jgi:hypothetical protein
MIGRELAIVFRARLTWISAALSALLVGHGFVLALDLYSAGSRSAEASVLIRQHFDPLLGIVRPTLGGLYLTISLLGPIVAARPLAVEKERRSFALLVLQTGAPYRVLLSKLAASFLGLSMQLCAPALLLALWIGAGGHLALAETLNVLLAYGLYAVLVSTLAVAAAAWTDTLAQAATATIVVIAASWAIDASEGFAALAWLGRALAWSVTTHIEPFERGTFAVGATLWMLAVGAGAVLFACLGVRHDLRLRTRAALAIACLLMTFYAAAAAQRIRTAFDLTEDDRLSLPPAAVKALRALPGPISLEVDLDRDDARRREMELDVLASLRLARPEIEVRFPPDDRDRPIESEHDEGYGRTTVRVRDAVKSTYSSSRREMVTLIFEAAGSELPDWGSREYPGYPLVLEGAARTKMVVFAYAIVPASFLVLGAWVTRSKRRRS